MAQNVFKKEWQLRNKENLPLSILKLAVENASLRASHIFYFPTFG